MTKNYFIMLPTVDFCFKELMQNPKVRKGFISALLNLSPDEVEDTVLLPTLLPRDSADDKLGIMDVLAWIRFFSVKNSREEFQTMAKTNEYLDEAYNTLLQPSADDKKRLEYEAREKALKDYNTQIKSAEKRGLKAGEEIGRKAGEEIGRKAGEEIGRKAGEEIGMCRGKELGEQEGERRTRQIFKLFMQGKSPEEIAALCNISIDKVKHILE
ncbi:hypothetical protein DWX43_22930 [Clostridium sp. AF19-22AC]|uniref:hypothetical protein n=1 Tax=Clostridia TaxID=186801 RepID=UPI000E4843FC|nr:MULTISPECIES: hypothetical protein [Clostridia]RHR21870.1 hypothetical protein DWX43_22930 [Clostridium sp. AF19-22AC]